MSVLILFIWTRLLTQTATIMCCRACNKGYENRGGQRGLLSLAWLEKDYPRLQILPIADLLQGKEVHMSPQYGTFKAAQRVQQVKPQAEQIEFEFQ